MTKLHENKGNTDYVNKLVSDYYYLVKIIQRKTFPSLNYDNALDFQQEGALGLMKAARTFSPEYGVKFSTYASQLIRNSMIDYSRSTRYLQSVKESLILDTACSEDSEDTLLDSLTCDDSFTTTTLEDLLFQESYRVWFESLSSDEIAILKMRLNGMTHKEIGEAKGFSDQTSGNKLKKIGSRWTKFCDV